MGNIFLKVLLKNSPPKLAVHLATNLACKKINEAEEHL